jgi:hypothetical protein
MRARVKVSRACGAVKSAGGGFRLLRARLRPSPRSP